MTIKLSDERKIKLLNSDDVYTVMRDVLMREEKIDREKEHFWMIGLATNNRLLYIELVSMGSVKATQVEPMNVYRVAVLKGAVKVIMVHNHPSGELRPSDADKDLTDRLIQVGRILDIEAIDHLIISTDSYMSFVDTGLFDELKNSTKWVPKYELVERIKKEEKKWKEEMEKATGTIEKLKVEKEKEKQKAEREKQKADREKQKTEREKQKAETEKQKAAREKKKAAEAIKAEKEKADKKLEQVKKDKIEAAKKGLKKGLPIEVISMLTGLGAAEIKKLK